MEADENKEQAKQLKGKRSRLKAKITSTVKLLMSNFNIRNIDNVFHNLEEVYSTFLECHYELQELIDSDESIEPVVAGLDMDAYLNKVQKTFQEANEYVIHTKLDTMSIDVTSVTDKARYFLEQLSSDTSITTSCIDSAKTLAHGMNEMLKELSNLSRSSSLFSNLSACLCDLDRIILEAEQRLSMSSMTTANHHPSINVTTNNTAHNLSNMHSLTHTESSRSGASASGGSDSMATGRVRFSTAAHGGGVRGRDSDLGGGSETDGGGGGADCEADGGSGEADCGRSDAGAGADRIESTRLSSSFGVSPGGAGQGLSGMHNSNFHSGIRGRDSLDLSIVTAYESLNPQRFNFRPDEGAHDEQQAQTTCTHRSKFKRAPPPTFGGNRKEWAEFRTVWRRFGRTEYSNDEERAYALKASLKGPALDCVRAIFVTQPNAYERIWQRLDNIYSDVSLSVQSTYEQLKKLKKVSEEDLKGLVAFVNDVELCYSQLGEIDQINSVTMTHVDEMSDLLPLLVRKEWMKVYSNLTPQQQIHPFSSFMRFLEGERSVAVRLSERQRETGKHKHKGSTFQSNTQVKSVEKGAVPSCYIHTKAAHTVSHCHKFKAMTQPEKVALLKQHQACFRCFGAHMRSECTSNANCERCGKDTHNSLLCRSKDNDKSTSNSNSKTVETATATSSSNSVEHKEHCGLHPIQSVRVLGTLKVATVFFDGGSNSTFITHKAARRLGAKQLSKVDLEMSTMGRKQSQLTTHLYEVNLLTSAGAKQTVKAYGIQDIMDPATPLDMSILQELFPHFESLEELQRKRVDIDLLIGNDYHGLHPTEQLAKAGEHLSIMRGPLGICLQGAHPRLQFAKPHSSLISVDCMMLDKVPESVHHRQFDKPDKFVLGEELGTEVMPKCGGCKCTKCPIVGHTYSFKEEQELELIRQNLRYDAEKEIWIAKYPWVIDPHTLPDNFPSALATLQNIERRLKQDKLWAETYHSQIQDMVDRGVARVLTPMEVAEWQGPVFYLSHLAVQNVKSTTTPVRIVFNSSQRYQGISLNSALAKGPDSYMNSLLGILLRWREAKVVLVGDIRKMYNSVYLEDLEQHCHRFLWRNMESRPPDIYIILRVNMGDKPAGAISSEALYKTADLFQEEYPLVADLLKHSTYVDDIVHSVDSREEADQLTRDADHVLSKGGFRTKGWTYSGDQQVVKVLGMLWDAAADVVFFSPSINFSAKKRGQYSQPDLTLDEIPKGIPSQLTRRIVLEQTMKLYDPLGLVCPFTLQAKVLLRETWELGLGWDEPVPDELREQWVTFFTDLFQLGELKYDRCLTPEDRVGKPALIILSDASDVAYGFSAYVRWRLKNGKFWCRLLMAKCRIRPIKRLSTPQMELNAAVLSKRGRKVIEGESRFEFEKVYHLVDSVTVLHMLNKVSTRFRLYEGVRVGEIQAATNGDLSEWFWVSGKNNTADWLTRCKSPSEISSSSEWWQGPRFLYSEEQFWGIKSISECSSDFDKQTLSCEKQVVVNLNEVKQVDTRFIAYERFSSFEWLTWVVAKVLRLLKDRSFIHGAHKAVTIEDYRQAKYSIIRDVQKDVEQDILLGKFHKLGVVKSEGLWVLRGRLRSYNPMTAIPHQLQILLPSQHWVTQLLLHQSHVDSGHRGRDVTLARFRQEYWVAQGAKQASAVVNSCQKCRLRDPKLISQEMGRLPEMRLKPSPPFCHTMVDLFGPFSVRGEVQKRITAKVYGVIFTDLASRAVHIEAAFGYDSSSFLMALSRFVCVRGWPQYLYSDPGTQLIGAERELTEMWKNMDKASIYKKSIENGTQWVFSPADSAWRQGAVESLVKAAKRCFKFALGTSRVSVPEFLTVCAHATSILNERPIGVLAEQDEEVSVLTPNCLLIGRPYTKNPGCWSTSSNINDRLQLVEAVTDQFWKKWVQLYAPSLTKQSKWYRSSAQLAPGDIVLVSDANVLRGQYRIAKVVEVFPDSEGRVRRVNLVYKNFRAGEKVSAYRGASEVIVSRSVQKLALLVPAGDAVGARA